MSIEEKGTVLVTGSNGGVGRGIVDFLLSSGFRNIACHYHRAKDNIELVLKKYGLSVEGHCFYADLTKEEDVAKLRGDIEKKKLPVTYLVNLAGGSTNSMAWDLTVEDFRKVIDQNLTSAYLCSKVFIPNMRKEQRGRIINVSSVVAFSGVIGACHYCAAKAGMIGLTKALALELASKKITVNAVALGYISDGLIHHISKEKQEEIKQQIPLKRFGRPGEAGAAIRFLLSDAAQYITGQVIHVNGGVY